MVFFIHSFCVVKYLRNILPINKMIYCDKSYLFILYLDMDDFTKKWLLSIGFEHLINTFEGNFYKLLN